MAEILELPQIKVGPLPRTDNYLFSKEDIIGFAEFYDPQPMHLDDVVAKNGPFGQIVASGWHGLAVTMRLLVTSRPFGEAHLVGAGVENIWFRKPLLPGTEIYVEAEVTKCEVTASGRRSRAAITAWTKDSQTGETIISQDWHIFIYPASPPG
jgi:acyl dehydratase